MSYEDYSAALDDLRKDALAWDDLSELFITVRSIVEGCEMPRYTMDGVGHMVGAEDNYTAAHTTFYELTSTAPTVFAQIADKLTETKRRYEEVDGYSQWLLDQG